MRRCCQVPSITSPSTCSCCLLFNLLLVSLKLYLLAASGGSSDPSFDDFPPENTPIPRLRTEEVFQPGVLPPNITDCTPHIVHACRTLTSHTIPHITIVSHITLSHVTHSTPTSHTDLPHVTEHLHMIPPSPFTCFAFTVHVLVTKETVTIVTSDLITWSNIPQHQYTSCVPPCGNKLEGRRGWRWSRVVYLAMKGSPCKLAGSLQ